MIGRTNTGGGGGALNFKVVGGTAEPVNPKENTIWVNTDTAISSWDFSATEPYRRSKNKNLNVYPYYHTTRTENGLTFTDNKDGTIKVNGTATKDTFFRLHYANDESVLELEPGTYTISDVAGTSNGRVELLGSYDNQTTWSTFAACNNNGKATFTITQKAIVRAAIKLYSGKTYNNVVFKPQIEKGSSATSFVKGDATGQVWIQTGATSPAVFNALKKNSIQVCPLNAKQYVNGAWGAKTAQTYQGGAWIDWYDKNARIAELNATGWARYSEGVSGEYVRIGNYGTTRSSTLPAIWCWEDEGTNYWGYCLLAASKTALAVASSTSYGGMAAVTSVKTPAGNILYIGRQESCHEGSSLKITSNGNTYSITSKTYAYRHKTGTLDTELLNWADELLFDVR